MPEQDTLKQGLQQKTIQDTSQREGKKKQNPFLIILAVLLMLIFTGLVGYVAYLFGKNEGLKEGSKTTTKTTIDAEDSDDATTISDETTEEETVDIGKETQKTGNFEITLTYPSEFVPPTRVCFENKNKSEDFYCFYQPYQTTLEMLSGTLPVGSYYSFLIVYSYDNSRPERLISLNNCNYNSRSGDDYETVIREKCADVISDIKEWESRYTLSGNLGLPFFSEGNPNKLGGDRHIFEIKENETLDMGQVTTIFHNLGNY